MLFGRNRVGWSDRLLLAVYGVFLKCTAPFGGVLYARNEEKVCEKCVRGHFSSCGQRDHPPDFYLRSHLESFAYTTAVNCVAELIQRGEDGCK
jgi:hypothetical protein